MPPKSSSSSSSPRRSSPRKPRKKEAPAVEQELDAPKEEASSADDQDFGAGIVEDEPARPRSESRRSESRTTESRSTESKSAEPKTPEPRTAEPRSAEPRREARSERPSRARGAESRGAESRSSESREEARTESRAPAPVEREREPEIQRPSRHVADDDDILDLNDVDLDDDDNDDGPDAGSQSGPSGTGEPGTGEGDDGDRRPRRRRRRRGRRTDGPTPPQQYNQSQGNQGGQSTQREHGSGGGGQHYNRPSNNSGSNSGGSYGGGGHGGGGYGGGGGGGYGGGHSGGGNNQRRRDQQPNRNRNSGPGNNNNSNNNRNRRVSKFEQNAAPSEPVATSGTIEGVLELHPKGYGFLRSPENDYGARETDAFVSSSFVEKHHLREGIRIRGEIGPGTRGQGPRVLTIDSVDGGSVEDYEKLKHFDTLTAINPFEQIKLETGAQPVTMRVMDLLCPIGKGQRALIVAPPRTGKTMLLQDIANAVSKNHPEIHLIVLLIDERPEEVTEMRRTVRGEVIASSMDQDVESHVRISQLIIERGKRLAESGKDCFILLDSITRTARAFNKWTRGGRDSKIQTGGLDVRAMDIPRKMFGTARRFDEGGSLTVCATALIDTGSRMDEAIFQEFKGTGNMEMVLSRDLADRRIWPSIDISKSGTRREEKIIDPELLDGIIMLRRSLVSMNPTEAMDQLIRTLAKFPTNREFLQKIRAVL
ncbi:transcription termination factor Rho [Planctomicrobium piriforme]|uniref:Transcription termination factor Rho n=1 Tax=Planctomicrobium piriforme TaxID=1576369 RepID=A0A1I3MKX0_9PLAN|nr:transcription termination factor Rho [Planctomicrobium piriforme]SFI97639.1 transcription termination factor Rho [Planctomicrobium piriforme]